MYFVVGSPDVPYFPGALVKYGTSGNPTTKYISRLQHTENTFARVVTANRTPHFSLAPLSQLHWLSVHDRIKFKIATMTHKVIYTGTPLPNLVQ